MNTAIRSHVAAAALLLLPLAGLVASPPAAAQHTAPARPAIQSLQAQAMGAARRGDTRPPVVSQLAPANGERSRERGRTFIHARLDDRGSGVDPRSVRLIVDGLDVTADARVTEDQVAYRERLGSGRHRAELVVRDRAGNISRAAWTFQVV